MSHRLTWRDWDRYSNRQGRKMTLGGFVGKGATFGLGQVQGA